MVFGHQLFLGFTWLRSVQKLILILLSNAPWHCVPALLKAWHGTGEQLTTTGMGLCLKGKRELSRLIAWVSGLEFNPGHPLLKARVKSLLWISLHALSAGFSHLDGEMIYFNWALYVDRSYWLLLTAGAVPPPSEDHGDTAVWSGPLPQGQDLEGLCFLFPSKCHKHECWLVVVSWKGKVIREMWLTSGASEMWHPHKLHRIWFWIWMPSVFKSP